MTSPAPFLESEAAGAPRPLRIALFTTMVSRGAFAAAFAGMAWALRAQGVSSVDVLFYKEDLEHARRAFPPNVRFVKLRGGRGLRAMGDLRGYLDRTRPDFLISAPVFVNLIAIVTSFVSRWRWSGGRVVITHHHPIELAHQNNRKDNKWLAKALYRFASGSFGVSPGAVSDACRQTYLDPARVPCIPNILGPCEEPETASSHPWLDQKSGFVFVSVSRLVKLKNIDLLVRSFARLARAREARLLICGDGPEREHLHGLIDALGLSDRVDLCGYVPSARLFMRKADAFVLASNEEGFGQVFTEAMSMGCPIIATRSLGGGAEYVLDGGRHGMLVPCNDERALAEAMLRMMDESVRSEYAARSRERARAFTPEHVGRELIEFLATCTGPVHEAARGRGGDA
jgi:glycosyltransferase involved in cell wall biosynthesis